jgi:hypothetical protein
LKIFKREAISNSFSLPKNNNHLTNPFPLKSKTPTNVHSSTPKKNYKKNWKPKTTITSEVSEEELPIEELHNKMLTTSET